MISVFPLPRNIRQSSIIVGDGRSTYGPSAFSVWDVADVVAEVKRGDNAYVAEAITAAKSNGAAFDVFTVTFSPALAASDRARVRSRRLHERSVDVFRGGSVSGAGLERELSVQGTVLQELRRDADEVEGVANSAAIAANLAAISAAIAEASSAAAAASAEASAEIASAISIGVSAQTFDSIAAFRAGLILPLVGTVNILGYYGKGTPGGGAFYLDDADATSADNGGTIIVKAGKRWKRPRTDRGVTLTEFGADPTGVVDAGPALIKALRGGSVCLHRLAGLLS